jgi:hypothetical protein
VLLGAPASAASASVTGSLPARLLASCAATAFGCRWPYVHACDHWRAGPPGPALTGRADPWIRWTTTGCLALLALIAGPVSYLHMRLLMELRGQPGWVAALTPLLVDGTMVAASTTRHGPSRSPRGWPRTGPQTPARLADSASSDGLPRRWPLPADRRVPGVRRPWPPRTRLAATSVRQRQPGVWPVPGRPIHRTRFSGSSA